MEILYEDNELLVVRKPAGMATQTRKIGEKDLESELKNYRARKKETPYIGVVHRLDQPVEGVMVFAKTPKAAADLSRQVQKRAIGKHYYALTVFSPSEDIPSQGELCDYMTTDKAKNCSYISTADDPKAKQAKLSYKIIWQKDKMALWDIQLHTGRQHQIRLQLSSRGCPIVGDTKYGNGPGFGKKIALCSYQIAFLHPSTQKPVSYEVKWDETPYL